jgi:hypothetical protein
MGMRYPHICSVFASALSSEHLQHVGQYESVALVFRVIPLEESTPVPLRLIRDGHFTIGRSFVTFLNPGTDGRMQHLASRQRLHKRSG